MPNDTFVSRAGESDFSSRFSPLSLCIVCKKPQTHQRDRARDSREKKNTVNNIIFLWIIDGKNPEDVVTKLTWGSFRLAPFKHP